MTQKRSFRTLAVLAALCLLLTPLCSALCITANADHDCCGKDCGVCRQIAFCETVLRSLTGTGVLAAAAGLLFAHIRALRTALQPAAGQVPATPVRLRVKLSN